MEWKSPAWGSFTSNTIINNACNSAAASPSLLYIIQFFTGGTLVDTCGCHKCSLCQRAAMQVGEMWCWKKKKGTVLLLFFQAIWDTEKQNFKKQGEKAKALAYRLLSLFCEAVVIWFPKLPLYLQDKTSLLCLWVYQLCQQCHRELSFL